MLSFLHFLGISLILAFSSCCSFTVGWQWGILNNCCYLLSGTSKLQSLEFFMFGHSNSSEGHKGSDTTEAIWHAQSTKDTKGLTFLRSVFVGWAEKAIWGAYTFISTPEDQTKQVSQAKTQEDNDVGIGNNKFKGLKLEKSKWKTTCVVIKFSKKYYCHRCGVLWSCFNLGWLAHHVLRSTHSSLK